MQIKNEKKPNGLYLLDYDGCNMFKKDKNDWYYYDMEKERWETFRMADYGICERAKILNKKEPKNLKDLFKLRRKYLKKHTKKILKREFNDICSEKIKKFIIFNRCKGGDKPSKKEVDNQIELIGECEVLLDYVSSIKKDIKKINKKIKKL